MFSSKARTKEALLAATPIFQVIGVEAFLTVTLTVTFGTVTFGTVTFGTVTLTPPEIDPVDLVLDDPEVEPVTLTVAGLTVTFGTVTLTAGLTVTFGTVTFGTVTFGTVTLTVGFGTAILTEPEAEPEAAGLATIDCKILLTAGTEAGVAAFSPNPVFKLFIKLAAAFWVLVKFHITFPNFLVHLTQLSPKVLTEAAVQQEDFKFLQKFKPVVAAVA